MFWWNWRRSVEAALNKRVEDQVMLISNMKIESAVHASITEIAKQVAHDIRSPVSALNIVVRSLVDIPNEKQGLMLAAIGRINDITNDLLATAKATKHKAVDRSLQGAQSSSQSELISEVLTEIYQEKKVIFDSNVNRKIDFRLDLKIDHKSLMIINRKELSRVISNVLNNAYEALETSGSKIMLGARIYGREAEVYVQDDGPGISTEFIEKLGKGEFSTKMHHSESGTGLGIQHARKAIEAMGGRFQILSALGNGTLVKIRLSLES